MSVNCPQCGAPADSLSKQCKFCGESLNIQNNVQNSSFSQQPVQPVFVQQPVQPVYVQPAPIQPVYIQQAPQNNGYDSNWPIKSKNVAGILAIFLGGIGIHKFYLGKIGLGIIYLLFSWTMIPSLIAFIEGLIYLFQSEHNFQVNNRVRTS